MPIITGESPSTWRGSESRPQNDFSFLRGGGVSGGGGKGDLEKKLAESNKANTKAPLPDDEPNGGESGVTYSKTKYSAHADPNAVLDSNAELGMTFWNKPVLDVNAVLKDIQLQNNIQATQVNTSTLNGISATVLAFVDGATSNIQAQIDAKATGTISLTAGETISGATTPVPVYLASDGKVYKADADSTTPEARCVFGFCITDATANNSATIQTDGILTVPTITLSETISSTLDQETYFGSAAMNITLSSTSTMFSQVFRTGGNVGNVSSIAIYESWNGTFTSVIDIFAIDADGKPTGTTLGTSQGVSHTGVSNGTKTYTFSTPVTVSPNTNYAIRISLSSNGTLWLEEANSIAKYTVLSAPTAMSYTSTDTGSTWSSSTYTLCFKTYTTNFTAQKGDGVFLSTTAGSYTNIQPTTTDCSHEKIGEIISTTQIKIHSKSKFLKKLTPTLPTTGGTPKIFAYAVKNATRCVIYSDLGLGTGSTNDYIKEELIKNEIIDVYITLPLSTTNSKVRLRWEGNVIIIERDAMTGAAISSLDLYFYS